MKGKTQVPDGWEVVRLANVAEIVMGQSPPGSTVSEWDGDSRVDTGLPFIQGNAEFGDISPQPAKWCGRPLKIAERGDTLISVRAPVGEVNRAGERTAIGRGLAAIRFTSADSHFGWHIVNRAKHEFDRVTQGSTFQAIGGNELRALSVFLPPPPEQRAISAVLDSIDEAIERTDAVIATTERLRDALLHELLTRGVPGWHSEWKEAPGIGTIPACWEVVRLGEVYEVQLGKMLSPKARQGRNPRPYLTNRNVRWGDFDLSDLSAMDFDHREIEKFQLRPGDLLVCEGGDTGRAAIWLGEIADCYYQKALHRLRPIDENVISEFMLAVLMSYATKGILLEHSERTSISHLTRERLLRMRIANPSRPEQEHIVAVLRSAATRIRNAQAERDALAVLKTSAAAALLTGSLRVSAWEG